MIKIRIAVAAVALSFIAATASFAANPHMGTWKLNAAKSKIAPGMGKNITVVYAEKKGKMEVTVDGRFDSRLDVNMKTRTLITLALGLAATAVCLAADTKLEQALRDLDDQWSKAASAKDLNKIVSYYAEGAMVMPPNAPSATIKKAIRSAQKELLTSPGAAISWKTNKVEVAQSGDIGYSSGTYEFTMNDATDKAVPDHGKYLKVWKKQANSKWKCVMDIWNSDLPTTSPASAEKK